MSKKVILVTGANSGIGLECCRALAKLENIHVIAAGRSKERIDEAVKEIKATASPSSAVEGVIVDLASLKSVREFADSINKRGLQLFSLVCNAGIQAKTKTTTVDGFESTIGTNHIGHFLLVKLLLDCTKRIITLASETHDPAEKTGMPAPNVSDLDQMAKGYTNFSGPEAYPTSKLCNMLLAKELARQHPEKEVLMYTPGLTPDTNLFREQSWILFKLLILVVRFVYLFRTDRLSTSEYSGGYLARVASAESLLDNGWRNGDYIRIDEPWQPSEQVRNPVLAKELWDKSEEWVRPFAQ
ncbi:hypothetical protein Poli38472_001110 [Pythium oligandrum]|uniref:Protochlorophyllide reductase n=1 Tax=Pythium oligandrum TaxID=41045 RepID=A0A8K1FQ19_PYTOL|nr:hypothetical protein Poli38472_001110 [Pythium oligandrum]|eukprot:TMW68954.1 hypothetical protein Poli38472_001110 [Pythium oligandrum]